jgi:hypothetical protein
MALLKVCLGIEPGGNPVAWLFHPNHPNSDGWDIGHKSTWPGKQSKRHRMLFMHAKSALI